MNVRPGIIALLAVYLPRLQDLPAPSLPVMTGAHALCDRAGSVSVAELAAVAEHIGDVADHPYLPAELQTFLQAVQDVLLGRRVRNQHGPAPDCRTCRRSGSGGSRRHVTAVVDLDV